MRDDDSKACGRRGALDVLKGVRSGAIQPSAVGTEERRVCVAYLRLEGYTQDEMAEIFRVHRRTVSRDERAIRKEAAALVDELDVRSVAGGLIAWGRHLTAKALKDGDSALAWRIQRELIQDLQSLGYLPRAPEQHTVQLSTFVDLARLAAEQQGQMKEAQVLALPEETEGDGQEETPADVSRGVEEVS